MNIFTVISKHSKGFFVTLVSIFLFPLTMAGETYNNEAATITWSMATGESSTATASPAAAIGATSWLCGSDIIIDGTATGTYWEKTFTRFTRNGDDKLDNKRDKLNNSYVEFKFTPSSGITITPTALSFDITKIGTGDPNIWVECIQGSNTTPIAENVTIRRDNEDTPSEHLSYTLTTLENITATTGETAIRIYIGKLANNKQVGIANVVISGTVSGTPQYTLTTAVTPEGSGTVTGGGTYNENANATLTATPNEGYTFVNWTKSSDSSTLTGNPLNVTVTADETYTANFIVTPPTTYTLTTAVSPEGYGTVTGGGTYDENANATLTATPSSGYKFDNWTKASDVTWISTTNPLEISVTTNETYTANFSGNATVNDLTVISSDYTFIADNITSNGTVKLSAKTLYDEGRILTSKENTVANNKGSNTFAGGSHLNSLRLKGTDNQLCIKVSGPCNITFYTESHNERGMKVGSSSGGAEYGSQTFGTSSWSCDVTTAGVVYLSGTSDLFLAGFELKFPKTLTTAVSPENSGTVAVKKSDDTVINPDTNGGSVYSIYAGSSIKLQATAEDGYTFEKWSDDNTDNPRTITISEDVTYTASFTANAPTTHDLTIAGVDNATVGVTVDETAVSLTDGKYVIVEGKTAYVTITANSGYTLNSVSDGTNNLEPTDGKYAVTMDADKTLTANITANSGNATVDDLTVISTDYVFIADDYNSNGTVALTDKTLYADGRVLSIGGNTAATSKGSSTISGVSHYRSLRLKNEANMLAINVSGTCKITFYTQSLSGNGVTVRTTKSATAEGCVTYGSQEDNTTEWSCNITTAGVVYIASSNGDCYIAGFKVEFPKTLTTAVNPEGKGTVSASGTGVEGNSPYTLPAGTSVTLTATVTDDNYEFDKWTKTVGETTSDLTETSATLSGYEVNENVTITAVFKEKSAAPATQYTLTFNTPANGTINWISPESPTSGTSYDENTTVSFKLTPDNGYEVDEVKNGTTTLTADGEGTYSFTLTADASISVSFKQQDSPPSGDEIPGTITLSNGTTSGNISYKTSSGAMEGIKNGGTVTYTVNSTAGGTYVMSLDMVRKWDGNDAMTVTVTDNTTSQAEATATYSWNTKTGADYVGTIVPLTGTITTGTKTVKLEFTSDTDNYICNFKNLCFIQDNSSSITGITAGNSLTASTGSGDTDWVINVPVNYSGAMVSFKPNVSHGSVSAKVGNETLTPDSEGTYSITTPDLGQSATVNLTLTADGGYIAEKTAYSLLVSRTNAVAMPTAVGSYINLGMGTVSGSGKIEKTDNGFGGNIGATRENTVYSIFVNNPTDNQEYLFTFATGNKSDNAKVRVDLIDLSHNNKNMMGSSGKVYEVKNTGSYDLNTINTRILTLNAGVHELKFSVDTNSDDNNCGNWGKVAFYATDAFDHIPGTLAIANGIYTKDGDGRITCKAADGIVDGIKTKAYATYYGYFTEAGSYDLTMDMRLFAGNGNKMAIEVRDMKDSSEKFTTTYSWTEATSGYQTITIPLDGSFTTGLKRVLLTFTSKGTDYICNFKAPTLTVNNNPQITNMDSDSKNVEVTPVDPETSEKGASWVMTVPSNTTITDVTFTPHKRDGNVTKVTAVDQDGNAVTVTGPDANGKYSVPTPDYGHETLVTMEFTPNVAAARRSTRAASVIIYKILIKRGGVSLPTPAGTYINLQNGIISGNGGFQNDGYTIANTKSDTKYELYVNNPTKQDYYLNLQTGCKFDGVKLKVALGKYLSETIELPNNGGWSLKSNHQFKLKDLAVGVHKLTITVVDGPADADKTLRGNWGNMAIYKAVYDDIPGTVDLQNGTLTGTLRNQNDEKTGKIVNVGYVRKDDVARYPLNCTKAGVYEMAMDVSCFRDSKVNIVIQDEDSKKEEVNMTYDFTKGGGWKNHGIVLDGELSKGAKLLYFIFSYTGTDNPNLLNYKGPTFTWKADHLSTIAGVSVTGQKVKDGTDTDWYVELPENLSDSKITFTPDVKYGKVSIKAVQGSQSVTVTDNGDGSFTIPAPDPTQSVYLTMTLKPSSNTMAARTEFTMKMLRLGPISLSKVEIDGIEMDEKTLAEVNKKQAATYKGVYTELPIVKAWVISGDTAEVSVPEINGQTATYKIHAPLGSKSKDYTLVIDGLHIYTAKESDEAIQLMYNVENRKEDKSAWSNGLYTLESAKIDGWSNARFKINSEFNTLILPSDVIVRKMVLREFKANSKSAKEGACLSSVTSEGATVWLPAKHTYQYGDENTYDLSITIDNHQPGEPIILNFTGGGQPVAWFDLIVQYVNPNTAPEVLDVTVTPTVDKNHCVVAVTFDRQMQDTKATLSDMTVSAEGGGILYFPIWDLDYDKKYTFKMPAGTAKDKYGNVNATDFETVIQIGEKPSYDKVPFDYVVSNIQELRSAIEEVNQSNATEDAERKVIFIRNGSYNIGSDVKGADYETNTKDIDRKADLLSLNAYNVSLIGESMTGVDICGEREGISYPILQLNSTGGNYLQDFTVTNYWDFGKERDAVAVAVSGGKHAVFNRIRMRSQQDTQVTGESGYYLNCEIYGAVDYICGGGNHYYDNCKLLMTNAGPITAPSTLPNQKWGYVFQDCTISTASGAEVGNGDYSLGRPWKNEPRTYFLNTHMNIKPVDEGWVAMGKLKTHFYEYNSIDEDGRTIDLSVRKNSPTSTNEYTPVLSSSESNKFTVRNVLGSIDSWLPTEDTVETDAVRITADGALLSWQEVDNVRCYVIFRNGSYYDNVVSNIYMAPEDGNYTIRAANHCGGLGKVSNTVSVSGLGTGIWDEPFSEETNEVTYYTTGGIRLDRPQKGLNIMVIKTPQGVKTKKIVIK